MTETKKTKLDDKSSDVDAIDLLDAAENDAVTASLLMPKFKVTLHKIDPKSKKLGEQIGVNGVIYDIQYGKEVIVPAGVVEVLRNAVQTNYVYDGTEMTESDSPAQPFSAVPA